MKYKLLAQRKCGQVEDTQRKIAKSDTFILDAIYVADPFSIIRLCLCFFRSNKTSSNITTKRKKENAHGRPENQVCFLFIAAKDNEDLFP